MVLTIAVNTTSTISVKDDDNELYRANCFFPEIVGKLEEIAATYSSDCFSVVVLNGQQYYTSKLLPKVKAMFGDGANIIVYGK